MEKHKRISVMFIGEPEKTRLHLKVQITMSFLFLRSWLALWRRSILFCSLLCFLVRVITDTLPKKQFNTGCYYVSQLQTLTDLL